MQKEINITLNGVPVVAREGITILEVARANGIDIPTLCYHPELTLSGSCRLCVVEVEGLRTLVASCHTPVTPGMVIQTHSPKVLEARRAIVELLLASHPESCVVCDKANICELRSIAADLDIGLPRFRIRKHYYPVEDISPYLVRDMSKCILCRRCTRACAEIAKQRVFAIAYRGFRSKVIAGCDEPVNTEVCRDCEVCVSVCPTGALCKPGKVSDIKRGKPLVLKG